MRNEKSFVLNNFFDQKISEKPQFLSIFNDFYKTIYTLKNTL